MILQEGKQKRPRRVMLYGGCGMGKSTWGGCAPKCMLFVRTENKTVNLTKATK